MWVMKTVEYEAIFSSMLKDTETVFKDGKPCTLNAFLNHLDETGKVGVQVECHELKEVPKADAVQGSTQCDAVEGPVYEISCGEDCLFHAKALPARTKATKLNAGSTMDFSQWNFKDQVHKLGRLRLVPCLTHEGVANAIVPLKPAILLTHPVKVKKGDIVLLG